MPQILTNETSTSPVSGSGLVSSGNKPLPLLILTQIWNITIGFWLSWWGFLLFFLACIHMFCYYPKFPIIFFRWLEATVVHSLGMYSGMAHCVNVYENRLELGMEVTVHIGRLGKEISTAKMFAADRRVQQDWSQDVKSIEFDKGVMCDDIFAKHWSLRDYFRH